MFSRLMWLFFFVIVFVNADPLRVSIYYESLCPDCIRFMTTQFYPSFEHVGNYLHVDLIPFGKATASNSSGQWKFQCQHGPKECYANKIQSCVIEFYSISSSAEFVNCAMNCEDPSSDAYLEICANTTNILWSSIKECLSSGQADNFLAENGNRTNSVVPPIAYVPTIIFNQVYNEYFQKEAEKHFLKIVCQLLKNKPDICKSVDVSVKLMA